MHRVLLVGTLSFACLNSNTDLSTTELAGNTSPADNSSTTDVAPTASTTSDRTTAALPCDDDPACGPDESVESCPAQCSECGDGKQTGDEPCDNGPDNQTYWPGTPPDGACSETCTTVLEWCGDAQQNGNEPCDNGTNADDPYSPTKPAPEACAPICTTVAYCGDSVQNGNEPCDTGTQSDTCELTCTAPTCGDGITNSAAGEACDDNNTDDGDGCSADCKFIERVVFVTSIQVKGDLSTLPPSDNPNNLSDLVLADFRCQTLAITAGLPGNYKAWLSTDAESPSTRFDTTHTGLSRLHSPESPSSPTGGHR